jgi:plastocyanin
MVAFSLVMDVEPGTYSYFCDIHPGMTGVITVVDDATPVPSPAEVLETAAAQLAMNAGMGMQAATEASMRPPVMTEDGGLAVDAGLQAGLAAVLAYFPSVAVIEAGQSVTWTIAPGMEPHSVTWPPLPPGSEVEVIPQDAGPPIIALSEHAFPSIESGAEIGAGDDFNSGLMFPGQSYTLTFTEPGVYNYLCFIHPGMQGAVVVMPATE